MPARDVKLPLRGDESAALSHKTQIFDITAPVERGQTVGHVEYFAGATRIADLPLVARDAVPRTLLSQALPPIGNRISFLPPAARILILGLLCLAAALVLLFLKLHSHGRRRPSRTFEPARLPRERKPQRDLAGRGR